MLRSLGLQSVSQRTVVGRQRNTIRCHRYSRPY
jgi:hypothetical protein